MWSFGCSSRLSPRAPFGGSRERPLQVRIALDFEEVRESDRELQEVPGLGVPEREVRGLGVLGL